MVGFPTGAWHQDGWLEGVITFSKWRVNFPGKVIMETLAVGIHAVPIAVIIGLGNQTLGYAI